MKRWHVLAGVILAWVFWVHSQKDYEVPGTWQVYGAWETKKECEVRKKSWFADNAKPILSPVDVSILIPDEKYSLKYPNGTILTETGLCLPDTIDPRK